MIFFGIYNEHINYLSFDNDIDKYNYHILKSIVLIQNKSSIITLYCHYPFNVELIPRLTRAKLPH